MNQPIVVSNLISADNTDVLNGTRLGTAPGDGVMIFEFTADNCNGTDAMSVSITLPGGDNPMDGVLIPAGGNGAAQTENVLDDRTVLKATYPVARGGKFQVSVVDVNGTATVVLYRISFVGA